MKPKVALMLPFWKVMYGESVGNLLGLMLSFPFSSLHTASNFRVDRCWESMTRSFMIHDNSHLFCLESDMLIPTEGIQSLLAHQAPIVMGNGFLLVEREVFTVMEPPWWTFEQGDGGPPRTAFLRRARDKGFEPVEDLSVHARPPTIGPRNQVFHHYSGAPGIEIALPILHVMHGESVCNLLALIMSSPIAAAHIITDYRVDEAREIMTANFLGGNGLYMFCLDSDMEIPSGAIDRLLSHKLPLVAGLYVSRHGAHWPFVWNEQRDEAGNFQGYQIIAEWPEGALIPCDITGAGFLLIAREVFESLGPPWWLLEEDDEAGTDIIFLRRAKAAGWQLYVDTSLQAGHFDTYKLTLKDFIDWREENKDRIVDPATEVEHGRNQES